MCYIENVVHIKWDLSGNRCPSPLDNCEIVSCLWQEVCLSWYNFMWLNLSVVVSGNWPWGLLYQ